jgi:hypothetical protein
MSADTPDPARRWRIRLASWLPALNLPDGHSLSPLAYQQRRISGGSLLHFLKLIDSYDAIEKLPILAAYPVEQRTFVFITDVPGAVAASEIIDASNPRALIVLKDLWRAWLDDPTMPHDDDFSLHYELWSAWHQHIDPQWELPSVPDSMQLWVHEEGFALADLHGRGAQHVWAWDGHTLHLIQRAVTSWDSKIDA